MEVTCERCSTVYDFDDALVSERGTTVKCTTCSHQFKVRRPAPTTGPDVWIVRTVNGREIEFAALRDLQSAIYDNRVTREDVLVRGSSRPRRLGSIAELEPFFNRTGVAVPNPQRRARTATAGTGATTAPAATAQRNETSVVFSLPNLMRPGSEPQDPHDESGTVRRGTLPPPPPMPVQSGGKQDVSSSFPPPRTPDAAPVPRRGSIPPPPPARRAFASSSHAIRVNPNPVPMFGDPNGTDYDDEWSTSGIERISALPPPPPPPRRNAPSAQPMFPHPEPPPPPVETDSAPRMFPDPEPPKIAKNQPPPLPKAAPAPAANENFVAAPTDKLSADKPDATTTNVAVRPKEPEAAVALPPGFSAPVEHVSKPATSEPIRTPVNESASASGRISMPSSRRSEPYSDPRFSGPVPSRRTGAARWIVGFVLLGCTALVAITIGPKLVAKPTTNATASDARVTTLLEQGDRAMNDGELEAANEAYVKASALADKDARVELRLARLAIVRADVPWLKARLLLESDLELANTRRELVLDAARADEATDRAQALVPTDPDVTRCRIDALRLKGNVAEARKLVGSLSKPTGGSNDEVLFALLDLAEPSPTWSSVIERLSNAARGEQNLGHARTMLIYALVQAGDIPRAKAELEQLVLMPRPHPLTGALRAYIARAEKVAVDGGTPDVDAGPTDDNAVLQSAIEATNSGDIEKAAGLLKDLETRLPNDSNVLTAAGKLALKKKDRAAAAKYFEKAFAADKNNFDAVAALADIKWELGEKQGASLLYRQIIERAGSDNPHLARAKERFAAFSNRIFGEDE